MGGGVGCHLDDGHAHVAPDAKADEEAQRRHEGDAVPLCASATCGHLTKASFTHV